MGQRRVYTLLVVDRFENTTAIGAYLLQRPAGVDLDFFGLDGAEEALGFGNGLCAIQSTRTWIGRERAEGFTTMLWARLPRIC